MSRRATAVLALLLTPPLLLFCDPAAAAQTVEQVAASYRSRADRLAAAGKLDLALARIGEAKERLHAERTASLRRLARPPRHPAYEKELRWLRAWLAKQGRLVAQRKADPAATTRAYSAKKAALDRKYAAQNARLDAAHRSRVAAIHGRYDLLIASMSDAGAGYQARKGDRDEAQILRREAAAARLETYRRLGKSKQAAEAARKLVAAAPADPDAHRLAGEFWQEQKQFGRASGFWQSGIRLLESGQVRTSGPEARPPSSAERSAALAVFYRQLAFCYDRLGKSAEMRQAMEKAMQADAAAAQGRRRPR